MTGGLRRFAAIFRQNLDRVDKEQRHAEDQRYLEALEAADDRQLRLDYRTLGQAASEAHLRDFRTRLYRELPRDERDALGVLIDVFRDRPRPFAAFAVEGTRFTITSIGHVEQQSYLWKLTLTIERQQGQPLYLPPGSLRQGIFILLDGLLPSTSRLFTDQLNGLKKQAGAEQRCARQWANTPLRDFANRIADDYWYMTDVYEGRLRGDIGRALAWFSWLRQFEAGRRDALCALATCGFANAVALAANDLEHDDLFNDEPPLYTSWTVSRYVHWWVTHDGVIGLASDSTAHTGGYLIPEYARDTMPGGAEVRVSMRGDGACA
jgi:hypothetical protein